MPLDKKYLSPTPDEDQQAPVTPSTGTENYTWEQAATDPDLLPAIKRYAKNLEGKTFKDDAEAFDWYKGDRRWKDSNTISALKELNRAAGGWGTVHLSKDDLQDLATIRDRWEKLPGGFSRIADGDIAGGVGAIAENVGKGLLDPSILLGGLASKAVTKTAAKIGVGMATDAAVTGAANLAMQQTNKEVHLQDEIDPWSALTSAGLGALLSAPGHISVATKTPKKLDVDLALKQTQGGYESLKGDKNLSEGLFNVGKRDRIVPKEMADEVDKQNMSATDKALADTFPAGEANVTNLNNATEARMKDLNSLEGTLASKVKIPAPKVIEKAKQVYDYISGKLININNTSDLAGLVQNVQGRFGDELFAKDATQGTQTWAATEAAAQRGLKGKDAEKVAQAVIDLPRNYNPSAVESRSVDIVRGAIYNKWDEAAAALEKDPTNVKLGREVERLFDMWSDLEVKNVAMGSEAGRALRIRAYKTNTPEGLFKKAGETAAKVLNAASGNRSTFTPDADLALQLRRAVKSLTDGDGNVDPLKVDLFLTNLESQKLGTKDAWQEAWYNSLLSSPSTMAVNAIGNTVTTALNATEQTLGSVMAGQSPVSAFKNVFAGYMGSIREATKVAFNTFKTEIPFDPMTRMEVSAGQAIPSYIWDSSIQGLNRFRKAGPGEGTELLSLKGAWGGRQARIPGRALMAADDFAKVGHYRMGLYSAAVDEIKAEEAKRGIPYSQNEFAQLLSDKVARPSDSASDYARNIARTLTFTNDPGPLARGAQQIIDDIPMGRMIVPFVRTPANIVKFAADMVLPSTKRTGEDLAAGGLRREAAKARLLTGWSIMAFGVWSGYSGLSTGAGPTDKETRESWLANNLPWSVKIPWTNTQVQWNRLDPVALPFAIGVGSVDMIKAMNDPQRESAFWDTTAQLFSDAILDKTWFQGVQNVVNAVSDPSRKMDSFGGGIVRTFVPSVVAGMARAYDPRVTAPQTYMEIMQDRIGFDAREKVPTKLDVLGRPVKVEVLGAGKDSSGILAGAARMISPFKTMETNVDPVAKELADLRTTVKSPDKKWNGIELNSEQYYALSKAKGEYLYNGLKWFTESPDWKNLDKGVRRMMVEELNKEASKVGEVMLIGTYPELLQRAYSVENNPTVKKFTNPTLQELNDTVKSPFGNPKLQPKDTTIGPKSEAAPDPALTPPTKEAEVVPQVPVETKEASVSPLTNQQTSVKIGFNNYKVSKTEDAQGITFDPLLGTIEVGHDVPDEAVKSFLEKKQTGWKNKTVKVKLDDGTTADVSAGKAAAIMKSKMSKAKKLLEEISNEA